FGALLADVLGERAGAADLAVFFLPEDVAEAGLALALRPGVHTVAECARAAGLCRDRPDLDLRVRGDHAREDLEARAGEVIGDGFHDDRVAKIGLVGTVLADRFVVRNTRPFLGDWLAFGKFLEDRGHHRT